MYCCNIRAGHGESNRLNGCNLVSHSQREPVEGVLCSATQVTLDRKLLPEMQMKAPVARVVGVCYIPLLPPECLITVIPSWDCQQVQPCLLYGRVCQNCSRRADKEKVRGGDRDMETPWEVPRASVLSVSRQLWDWGRGAGVDTVGILSEFRIRR